MWLETISPLPFLTEPDYFCFVLYPYPAWEAHQEQDNGILFTPYFVYQFLKTNTYGLHHINEFIYFTVWLGCWISDHPYFVTEVG